MAADQIHKGYLHVQSLGLLQKWKRMYCVLFASSPQGIQRMEKFRTEGDYRDGHPPKTIRLNDCTSIRQHPVAGSTLRHTFLLVTSEKSHLFAANKEDECKEWVEKISSVAFADARSKRIPSTRVQRESRTPTDSNWADVYDEAWDAKDFPILVVPTPASQEKKLVGQFNLSLGNEGILLKQETSAYDFCNYREISRVGVGTDHFFLELGEGKVFEFLRADPQQLLQALRKHLTLQQESRSSKSCMIRTEHDYSNVYYAWHGHSSSQGSYGPEGSGAVSAQEEEEEEEPGYAAYNEPSLHNSAPLQSGPKACAAPAMLLDDGGSRKSAKIPPKPILDKAYSNDNPDGGMPEGAKGEVTRQIGVGLFEKTRALFNRSDKTTTSTATKSDASVKARKVSDVAVAFSVKNKSIETTRLDEQQKKFDTISNETYEEIFPRNTAEHSVPAERAKTLDDKSNKVVRPCTNEPNMPMQSMPKKSVYDKPELEPTARVDPGDEDDNDPAYAAIAKDKTSEIIEIPQKTLPSQDVEDKRSNDYFDVALSSAASDQRKSADESAGARGEREKRDVRRPSVPVVKPQVAEKPRRLRQGSSGDVGDRGSSISHTKM